MRKTSQTPRARDNQAPNSSSATYVQVERVARESYGKLIAILAARVGDLTLAEDALSSALLKALAKWPQDGVPASPEAWLLTVARRRAVDHKRRALRDAPLDDQHRDILQDVTLPEAGAWPDRRLALLFVCSHPAIEPAARAPLILQTVLGLEAAHIARAFLVSPTTMAQRLVRAKRKIQSAGIPFSIPLAGELAPRLDAVLDALYACYSEAWSTPPGGDDLRADLAGEAIWLARMLVDLCPAEPEVAGLLALLLFLQARAPARRGAAGEYVPLNEQDTSLWDTRTIAEAESLLRRAAQSGRFGRFQLEAAIQSAHCARALTGITDWNNILLLYDALAHLCSSPVISINQAVALSQSAGQGAGLAALDDLRDEKGFETYQPYWAARADLLGSLGRNSEAAEAYDRAIKLSRDPALASFLESKKNALKKAL